MEYERAEMTVVTFEEMEVFTSIELPPISLDD